MLDANLAKLEAVVTELEKIEGIHIPTWREAISGEWDFVADDMLEMAGSGYERFDRSGDSQRVISMSAAQQVLQAYEAFIVDAMVLKPHQLIWRRLTTPVEAAKFLIEHPEEIFEALKELIEADDIIDFVVNYGVTLFTIAQCKKAMKVAIQCRKDFEKKMRAKAFPQSTGKRHWRKTVTTL